MVLILEYQDHGMSVPTSRWFARALPTRYNYTRRQDSMCVKCSAFEKTFLVRLETTSTCTSLTVPLLKTLRHCAHWEKAALHIKAALELG